MTATTTDAVTVAPVRAADQTLRHPRLRGGDLTFAGIAHVLLIIWSIIIVVPVLWTIMSSFKTSSEIFASPFSLPENWSLVNYQTAWEQAGIGRYFLNTIIVVGSALFLVMLLGSMCAYVLARFQFPGRRLIYYLMLAGNTFPIFLAIVPLFFVLKGFMLLNTLQGLIITYVAFALPFTVFFLYAFFRTLPHEVAEAAAVDGAGKWATFFRVMLPMAKPGLASITIFNFLGLWNQFLIPVAINTRQDNWVLSQGLASFAGQMGYRTDFGALFASVVITIVPVLVMYVIFQRQLQNSVTQGAVK